jgi:phospholipase C
MEKILSHKTGKQVEESNINSWRRTVCGDLTSVFKAADDAATPMKPLVHNDFVTKIHQAKFKELPSGYRALTDAELAEIRQSPRNSDLLPKQEGGHRPSAPLPYELSVFAALNSTRDRIEITLQANNQLFKEKASGAPFTAYAFTKGNQFSCRNYAVAAGDKLEDSWSLADFDQGIYQIKVYGPNGYYWSLRGSSHDPHLSVRLAPAILNASPAYAEILLSSNSAASETVKLADASYGHPVQTKNLAAKEVGSMTVSTESSSRWYDFSLTVENDPHFERRFAGRLENGTWGQSDPVIGTSS